MAQHGIRMDSKLFSLGIDPIYIIAVLAAITIVTLVVCLIVNVRCIRMWHRYDRFMRGKDAETLEEVINQLVQEFGTLKDDQKCIDDQMQKLSGNVKGTIKKFAVRKYNAFKDVGGKLSFSLVLLDGENNGFILTCMHANGPSYTYIKEIIEGESYVGLSTEEDEALKEAVEYGKYI